MDEIQKRRISLLNQHLDNTRAFQYKYFEHLYSSLAKSETAMMAAFLSFSSLGINYSINHRTSFEIWLFSVVIFINLGWPLISNIYKQKKSQHFLNIIRDLEAPVHEFTDSMNLKSWNEIEISYSSRFSKFSQQIDEGNRMYKWIDISYNTLRIISFLLLTAGWIKLILPYFSK
ncbi:hypothetical protein EV198_1902 [Roseivirga ehrenbergii]|uniref:Uncharacterized protein n=1 Tax=Roseivirga ehrenbergii (strain DSM 102268 / JCM 13514 / KCTC 12282 / NCIMB 14502 / KMM 6017) TaxID=279360 RepID=A0A150XSW1_ROSEK|nr:hypothetical protein MB14_14020 [Roseivirga ehrenbergii]TCL10870.1 hypothetical protein EV198_1902 [Roseivirga ehrenbergii]